MNEALIASLIEKSVIGGAFIYMLHYFLGRFSKALEAIGESLEVVSNNQIKMDSKVNRRLDNFENRLDRIERRGNDG